MIFRVRLIDLSLDDFFRAGLQFARLRVRERLQNNFYNSVPHIK